jgi:type I restriction enzyme M protein
MSETKKSTFEQQLFKAADKLRKNIDAAEYKYVVLGLVFINISPKPSMNYMKN